jgi:hypothetical protein
MDEATKASLAADLMLPSCHASLLGASTAMKSRVTVRKEIMDLYKEEKNLLYAQFSKLSCRVSFTMDT